MTNVSCEWLIDRIKESELMQHKVNGIDKKYGIDRSGPEPVMFRTTQVCNRRSNLMSHQLAEICFNHFACTFLSLFFSIPYTITIRNDITVALVREILSQRWSGQRSVMYESEVPVIRLCG